MLYKIGDFSKLTNLSIRTLRYYDDIDLFKPKEIDLFTNYRYYSSDQLEDLKIIKDLQDVGFTLEEIKEYKNNLSNEIMLNKKNELLKEIEIVQDKIKKVDYLRENIVDGKICYKKKQNKNKSKTLFN